MNRFHVHLNVADLASSIRFYTELFAAPPSVVKGDYAKWMLDDPRVNFAISNTGRAPGVDHLGIQVERAEDLSDLGRRLDAAGGEVVPEPGAICCYANSDKMWTHDPQGTRWETFHTHGEATSYYAADTSCSTGAASCSPGTSAPAPAVRASTAACCAPASGCC
ncbi:ArsI/CadI family heavy metal resistance metalloenzyme [Lysobacter sp. GCM10012299]|uniref:ArsI/CadI family heavy metal resistance metalloenzyme n=1 Tax=Lysobacter sp. GCM10012299 TaxID=3317333 RepID=UPI003621C4EC